MIKYLKILFVRLIIEQGGFAKINVPLQSQNVSGRVINVIHQAWRGLNVVRKFTMPVIRHTVSQMARRANFSTTSKNWKEILTQPERDSWNALKMSIKDLWGNEVKATGLNLYKKINEILIDAGKTLLTIAPITKAIESPTCTLLNDNTGNIVTVGKPTAGEVSEYAPFIDVWVAGLSAFVSTISNATILTTSGVSPSVNPGKGLYRHIAFIDENSSANQTIMLRSAEAVDLPAGVKVSVIVVRYTKDGMKSVPVKLEGVSVAHS